MLSRSPSVRETWSWPVGSSRVSCSLKHRKEQWGDGDIHESLLASAP